MNVDRVPWVQGPAILSESTGTTVLEPGWAATVAPGGLTLQRVVPLARKVTKTNP